MKRIFREKKNKKSLSVFALVLLVVIIAIGMLGCAKKEQEGKIRVVATIFPLYDWAKEIIKDNDAIELTLLVENGMDLHNYLPSAADLIQIADCDVLLYVGGVSDAWVEEAIKSSKKESRKLINCLDLLGDRAKEEEIVEGMQEEDHHEEDHHEENDETEWDEHIWLSLQNAIFFVNAFRDAFVSLVPTQKETLEGNAYHYLQQLSDLEEEYRKVAEQSAKKTLLFCDRFPFRYLVEDYGLTYYAAFPGCSAETEASFSTVTFLTKQLDILDLSVVLILEGSDGKLATTVIENTKKQNQTIETLHSLQSVSRTQIENKISYLSVMKENLIVLKKALGE